MRRRTLALAEKAEVDYGKREWHVPAAHDKERREHIVPLTDFVIESFKALDALSPDSVFFLPNQSSKQPANPRLISRTVARLQERFQAIGIAHFTVHDIRRTVRTLLAKLGVLPHIGERVLNHAQGEVEGIYDLHDYLKQKRAALTRLEKFLRKLEARPRTEPTAELIMKEIFKAKLKNRRRGTPKTGQRKKSTGPVRRNQVAAQIH